MLFRSTETWQSGEVMETSVTYIELLEEKTAAIGNIAPFCYGDLWRQARQCSTGNLVDAWLPLTTLAGADVTYTNGTLWYHFALTNPVSASPGTAFNPAGWTIDPGGCPAAPEDCSTPSLPDIITLPDSVMDQIAEILSLAASECDADHQGGAIAAGAHALTNEISIESADDGYIEIGRAHV